MRNRAEIRKQVIKNLIQYYQVLDEIKAEEMKELSDIDYEIASGCNYLIASNQVTQENTAENIYNNMRGRVDNCTKVFEEQKIEVYEANNGDGDIFEKPQFFLFQYGEKDATAFLKAYLEITFAKNKNDKSLQRFMKNNLNGEINADADFSGVNKVLKAAGSDFAQILYDYLNESTKDLEKWLSRIILLGQMAKIDKKKGEKGEDCYSRRELNQIAAYQRLAVTKQCIEEKERLIKEIILWLKGKPQKTKSRRVKMVKRQASCWNSIRDLCKENKKILRVVKISVLWSVMLDSLLKAMNQLLLGECISSKTVDIRCQKIKEIHLNKDKLCDKKIGNIYEDFWLYSFIIYMQNQEIGNYCMYHHSVRLVSSLDPIKEEYLFTTEDNRLKEQTPPEGNFVYVKNNKKHYFDYFNLGMKISDTTYKKYVNAIINDTEEFNQKMRRFIRPDRDICVFRAFYRAMYIVGDDQTKKNKDFNNFWKKYTKNDLKDKNKNRMKYNSLLSCLIHFEYRRGGEHLICNDKLMKSIHIVMNSAFIQLVYAVFEGISIRDCYCELDKMHQRIFKILCEEEGQCL